MITKQNTEAGSDPDAQRVSGVGTADNRPVSNRGGKKPRRINVAVTPDMVEAIELIMDKDDVSLTEAVRRLLSYGEFVYRAIREDGSEVLIKNGDKTKEVVLLT